MGEPQHGTISRYSSARFLCRCDECRAAATTYQNNRRRTRPDVRAKANLVTLERYRRIMAYIKSAKDKPCVDCKKSYPVACMQFDHLPGHKKLYNISLMRTHSLEKIKAEIAKCEVVCANCHAIRTTERRCGKL